MRLTRLTLPFLFVFVATPASPQSPVRICAGGDVTLSTNTDTSWVEAASSRRGYRVSALPDPLALVSQLTPFFAGSDIVLVNVESAIGRGPFPRKCHGSDHCFEFRAPLSAAPALASISPGSAVVANVANNHSHDVGPAGFLKTVAALTSAGVFVTGADTLATAVALDGDTVAFLGFHTSSDVPDARNLGLVARSVARARARWPLVVVTMHLGAEGVHAQRVRDKEEIFLDMNRGNPVAFAHVAIRSGASVVFGHGPHVLRAAERYQGGVIFYSLGNLLTYGPFLNKPPMDRAVIACVSLGHEGVGDVRLVSVRQLYPGTVVLDPSLRGYHLVDSLSRLDFPLTALLDSARF